MGQESAHQKYERAERWRWHLAVANCFKSIALGPPGKEETDSRGEKRWSSAENTWVLFKIAYQIQKWLRIRPVPWNQKNGKRRISDVSEGFRHFDISESVHFALQSYLFKFNTIDFWVIQGRSTPDWYRICMGQIQRNQKSTSIYQKCAWLSKKCEQDIKSPPRICVGKWPKRNLFQHRRSKYGSWTRKMPENFEPNPKGVEGQETSGGSGSKYEKKITISK